MIRVLCVLVLLVQWGLSLNGQSFRFALVTDTHVGGATGLEDLERTVRDLNQARLAEFVIFSGDVTEFGSDQELREAHAALEKLEIPWYIVPGNHDTNWSESGGNSFLTVFGADHFAFEHQGVLFIGTSSGPYLRMAPGQVPREHLVWLDSILNERAADRKPLIFINHYPLDESLNNWYEVIDRLKNYNIQLSLCGHGHQNRLFDFEGIPGVMSRSNLRAADTVGAYQIIEYTPNQTTFTLRYPEAYTAEDPWLTVPMRDHQFHLQETSYPRPDFAVNEAYQSLRASQWRYQDASDLGAGFAHYRHTLITANTAGQVYVLNTNDGTQEWSFQTNGKVYATPAVWEDYVVVGSSDHHIYGLDAATGTQRWSLRTDHAVLGSPLIHEGVVYIGGSDGVFRAIDVETGSLVWSFEGVKNYVSAKPLYYQDKIYFGSWGNDFYALNPHTGELIWEWSNGSSNRMFSPAACYPVGANGRVFIVAPDRYMTALDAETGAVIWRENPEKEHGIRVRESMGLSEDGSMVYVKTMDGQLLGYSTEADHMKRVWTSQLQLPYELTPSAIEARDGLVFVPSHSGLLSAVDAHSGQVRWQSKLSNGMINPLKVLPGKRIAVSTMDGVIELIKYEGMPSRL